jgi:hypothetical protein
MTKKRGSNRRLSSRVLITIAAASLIGIGINTFLLSTNGANKPKASTYSGCADVTYHDGIIGEADLSCGVRYQKALDSWRAFNYVYTTLIGILASVLIVDGIIIYKMRKSLRNKLQ